MSQSQQPEEGVDKAQAALAVALWMSRPALLATSRSRTVGRRHARSGREAAFALGLLYLWAALGQSAILGWFFVLSLAVQAAHALQPGLGHTRYIGDSVVGHWLGCQRRGRTVECLLFVAGGVFAGSRGDAAAQGYFVLSGLSGLAVLAVIRGRERDADDDLADGMIEARARAGRF